VVSDPCVQCFSLGLLTAHWPRPSISPPQTLFAVSAAPSCCPSRLPHAFLWFWAHALQFALANQSLPHAISEDTLNHPYRPIPAGRVSVQTARVLRWTMIPSCLLVSAFHGPRTILASILGSLFILVYNEGGGARSHWLVRNAENAVGYSVAKAGTMLVLCQRESEVDSTGCIATALSAGIILTTIHTQDYKDVPGDAAAGRVTLPIAYPTLSRFVTAFILVAWSWGVSLTWRLDNITAAFMGVLALVVGVSFVVRRDLHADLVSAYLYNVWLCAIYLLPGYYRLRWVS